MPQPKIESSFHSSIISREVIWNGTGFAVLHPYTTFAAIVLPVRWISLIEGSPMVCLGHTTLLEGQLQEDQIQLLVEQSSWCRPAHAVPNPLVPVANNTSLIKKTGSTDQRICFCWRRNAIKRHSLACVFMVVKASCVDLDSLCIFSVLLFTLAVYLPLCVLQRCQQFWQPFQ